MKRLLILALVLGPLLVIMEPNGIALWQRGGHWERPVPFQLRVLDRRTGLGIEGARVTSDNGLSDVTKPDGSVFFAEASVMDREVQFTIERGEQRVQTTVRPYRDDYAVVTIP